MNTRLRVFWFPLVLLWFPWVLFCSPSAPSGSAFVWLPLAPLWFPVVPFGRPSWFPFVLLAFSLFPSGSLRCPLVPFLLPWVSLWPSWVVFRALWLLSVLSGCPWASLGFSPLFPLALLGLFWLLWALSGSRWSSSGSLWLPLSALGFGFSRSVPGAG